ncbi:ribosome maturation factor RimM [Zafaria cholistanensis]|uniref:Ribosome maturation factor RimM n=1 Tax=Zafaria cholistanensis TaxID=1682741 RepID=A0A5A7NMF3_9MICC|nr:ribosome maturation factor RimM [Zafaria cholistanensis]GER21950.1 ribosome maturation factor RimM [Zafaria cholistanensis]
MRLQVARIGKPHGIRGEVTVQVMTDAPEERFLPGTELIVEPAKLGTLTVAGARWNKDILLLAFKEVRDRNTAETLRGAQLFVDAEDDEDDEDAWYEHELEGLDVRVDGASVGKVTGLRTHAAQDLLIVEAADGAEVLVPFVEEIVPEVDLEGGFVVVTPPPGLFELNRDDAEGRD